MSYQDDQVTEGLTCHTAMCRLCPEGRGEESGRKVARKLSACLEGWLRFPCGGWMTRENSGTQRLHGKQIWAQVREDMMAWTQAGVEGV